MKRHWKHYYFLAAVAVVAIGATDLTAEEPVEWCDTYEHWVAKVGYQGGVAGEACPTQGTCDTPPVRDSWIPGPSTPIVEIRVKFNIFCNDDGTNCASDEAGVDAQMTQLNLDYEPYRIHFTENTEYINDSTYRDLYSESDVEEMKNTYADDPDHQLNVYVVNVGFARGTFPWDPDALGNQGGIFIDDDLFGLGQKILTHESGHNLGLWHTHHGVSEFHDLPCYEIDGDPCDCPCYERANGQDADTTGDFASDTPPTPVWYWCSHPLDDDPCSATPWAPTQPENYMSYAEVEDEGCWTLFTSQQAGRMHCWIDDVLTGWIPCTTNEVPGSTCQDGIDNDCDGYADCDDAADCEPDSACYCDDNGGLSPLVCVYWDGAIPPESPTDFFFDFGTDPDNPDVTFVTGNDGWVVWSQVSLTDDTPANLGDVGIDPTLPTANFSVTLAHGESAGAANVASISLVDVGWTGQSNLSGGSIAGNLMGALVLQESGGQGGVGSFTIGGDLYGNMTIPKVDTLHVKGAVGSDAMITLFGFEMDGDKRVEFNTDAGDDFAGDLSFPNGLPWDAVVSIGGLLTDTASVDFNGEELAGVLSFGGGSAEQSVIDVGPLTGRIYFSNYAYLGSATLASVESSGVFSIASADLSGSINVLGDWSGTLWLLGGNLAATGVIDIDGNVSGDVQVMGHALGDIEIGGNITSTGHVAVLNNFSGDLTVSGDAGGEISIGGNLSGNVDVADVSGTMTVTGDFLSGGYWFTADDISGSLSIGGNAYGYVELAEFTGSLSVTGDVDCTWLIIEGSASGDISGGAVSGLVVLANGDGNAYSGTATFSSVAGDGFVGTWASLSGTIHVTGNVDVDGTVLAWPYSSDPALTETGLIDIDGNVSGQVTAISSVEVLGDIEIGGNITSTGRVEVWGNMSGDLTVSGDAAGEISIGGDLSGNVDVADVSGTMTVTGDFLSGGYWFTADDISGSLSIGGNAYGAVELEEFTGSLSVTGDVDFEWLIIWGSGSGDITGGAVTSPLVVLASGGNQYSGTATFSSVGGDGVVATSGAGLSGTIRVTGNVSGTVAAIAFGSNPGLLYGGLIDVDGNVSGYVKVAEDARGNIDIAGNITSTGQVLVRGDISGDVTVSGYVDGEILANSDGIGTGEITGAVTITGEFDGNICADNLYADECLPENINIQSFGPDWTVCDEPGCICDLDSPTAASEEEGFDKNRYLSFVPSNAGLQTALRLTLQGSALQWWVGEPEQFCENAGQDSPPPGGCGPAPGLPSTTFMGAHRVCEPYYADWPADVGSGVALHVYGEDIVPGETYEVQAIGENCDPEIESNYSPALAVTMTLWGDVCGAFREGRWNPPDGSVDVTTDVAAMLDKFRNLPGAPIKARCDLDPELVQQIVDMTDVGRVLDAFRGFDYPFDPPSSGCN